MHLILMYDLISHAFELEKREREREREAVMNGVS